MATRLLPLKRAQSTEWHEDKRKAKGQLWLGRIYPACQPFPTISEAQSFLGIHAMRIWTSCPNSLQRRVLALSSCHSAVYPLPATPRAEHFGRKSNARRHESCQSSL